MAEYAHLPWTQILSAEDFRHYKPDKEVYLGAVKHFGRKPEELMMCASHGRDLQAARNCGLKTAFWPRPTEYGSTKEIKVEEPEKPWDIVARDIEDLARQLLAEAT